MKYFIVACHLIRPLSRMELKAVSKALVHCPPATTREDPKWIQPQSWGLSVSKY